MPALMLFAASLSPFIQPLEGQSTGPTATENWKVGPGHASLGPAEVQIPAGYKFLDAQGAAAVLHGQGVGTPPDLVGYMTPVDRDGWSVVFQFEATGYIKDRPASSFDPEAMLESLKRQTGSRGAEFQVKPAYDRTNHRLEYALSMPSTSGASPSRSYVALFLGRHGVLRATVKVQGQPLLEALHDVTQVSFHQGESYADFRKGDALASLGLADLVAYQPAAEPASGSKPAGVGGIFLWVILLALLAGGGVILFLRRKPHADLTQNPDAVTESSAPARLTAVQADAAAAGTPPLSQPNAPLPSPAFVKPRLGPTPLPAKLANGQRLRTFSSHFSRRQKEFDYNRYFADLMSMVSGHTRHVESAPTGYAVEVTQLPEAIRQAPSASAAANAELIANQTTLIEEQRRLIQEQTRLIEEKAKLIAEKNQLLKLQAELMENKLL